jgi:hypothetical protein
MTAKSRQRYDTLDLLLFFFCCVLLSLRRNETYILLFSHLLMKVYWALYHGVFFFSVLSTIYL